MQFGICKLSIVPVRILNTDKSEMVTQLIYGDIFLILEEKENWTKIKSDFDNYVGWIDTKQYQKINKTSITNFKKHYYSSDLVEFVENEKNELVTIIIGSVISNSNILNHKFEGNYLSGKQSRESIVKIALLYLNTPYLWGGKTPFGIDCSGFTQMIYRLHGKEIPRDAYQQAEIGTTLSFIEESEAGDLAFFDNNEGKIIHVGVILENNFIIHASGKVRIDRLDQQGIFNAEERKHTHKLRLIKSIL